MSVMKKTMLSAVILAGMGVNMAHAGSVHVEGNGAPASADVVFGQPENISHTLTPVSGLAAGDVKSGVKVANGVIHSLDGSAHLYDLRWGAGATDITFGDKDYPTASFLGKNDSTHKLVVRMGTADYSEQYADNNNHGIVISRDGAPARTVNYRIVTNGAQTVAADTYTISTVAFTYSS